MPQSTTKKILPTADYVALKEQKAEEKSAGGIILPGSQAKTQTAICEVIAVGPGRMTPAGVRVDMPVAVGQKVICEKYAGTEVEVDGEKYILAKATEIVAVIE